ncbi:hypothetical protein DICVIV_06343 [Dictyocaulus viviparus]|uniref:C2 domain protein n=1 Tax=Dictyocaulus viviparus TaxID=29172 RepID=A0A0D8XZ08_DICVI|nr:hypothetical protein DICVIV_06343 [Dictyocaulus viviparus]
MNLTLYLGKKQYVVCLGWRKLTAERAQIPEKEQPIIVQLHGRSLDRKDLIWDETAVYRLEQGKDEDELVLLYESEAIRNHSHPQWSEFRLGTQDAADNRNRLLEIWVMYRDVDGSEGYIGKFLTTYAKMKYGPGPDNVYAVINESKQLKKVGCSPVSLTKSSGVFTSTKSLIQNYENSGRMELSDTMRTESFEKLKDMKTLTSVARSARRLWSTTIPQKYHETRPTIAYVGEN